MINRQNLPDNISANAEELCSKSAMLNINENPEKVISLLEEAFADSPDSRKVILMLTSAYLNTGSTVKAIKILENSVKSAPTDMDIHNQLAEAYAERKWNKKALNEYSVCLGSDYLCPEYIQSFAEFCMDNEEYSCLTERLSSFAESESASDEIAAVSAAMLFACMSDAAVCKKDCSLSLKYFEDIFLNKKCSKEFFTMFTSYLSETPNDISISNLYNSLFDAVSSKITELSASREFHKARAEFEVSLVLYSNDVSILTVLAMRNVKFIYNADKSNFNELKYLVFDSHLSLIDAIRGNQISDSQIEQFKNRYHMLWSIIGELVTRMTTADDLKAISKQLLLFDLINPSPEYREVLRKNLSEETYNKLQPYMNAKIQPVSEPRKSEKISPNAPCPCGSGVKYKKCCGLKK